MLLRAENTIQNNSKKSDIHRVHQIDRISKVSGKNAGRIYGARNHRRWQAHRRNCDSSQIRKSSLKTESISFVAKIVNLDVPVDLLRRFSQPDGSSSSAIAVRVFSVFCFFSGRVKRRSSPSRWSWCRATCAVVLCYQVSQLGDYDLPVNMICIYGKGQSTIGSFYNIVFQIR